MENKTNEERIRLSPSAINTYLQCPRDFYYKYILRLPQPPQIQLIKGTIVHRALELFYEKPPTTDNLYEHMKLAFSIALTEEMNKLKELRLTHEEEKKEIQSMEKQLNLYTSMLTLQIDIVIDSGKAETVKHAFRLLQPKMREEWIEDTELGLCGYIDRINKDFSGKITISDYKTSSRYGTGIKDEYLLQCGLYALLYLRKYGHAPHEISIIYLRYGTEVVTTVTPLLIQKALEAVEYVRERTKSTDIKDYPCAQHKLCSYSPWFNRKAGICELEDKLFAQKTIEELK